MSFNSARQEARPIGEVLRRIVGKAILSTLKPKILESAGGFAIVRWSASWM